MERILLRKELPNKIPQNMFDTFTYQVYRKYCKDFSSWLEENYQVRYSGQLDHVDLDTILSNYESYLRKARIKRHICQNVSALFDIWVRARSFF